MKRLTKRIMSWLCLMLMSISMVIPVMAEVNPSANTGAIAENFPIVTGISYGGTYMNAVPVINKDTVPFAVGLTITNNIPGTYTCKITSVELVYSEGDKEVVCQSECRFAIKDAVRTFYVNAGLFTDNAAPGTYSLSKIVLKGLDSNNKAYEKEFSDINSIAGAADKKVTVSDIKIPEFGTVSVGLDKDMNVNSRKVVLNNDNVEEIIDYYITTTGNAKIKSARIYWGYMDGEIMREMSTQSSTKKISEGVYISRTKLQSHYKTNEYRVSKIAITDSNDMSYIFYNTEWDAYKDATKTVISDFVISVENTVDKEMLSLYKFSFFDGNLNRSYSSWTSKVSGSEIKVPVSLEARAVDNNVTLNCATVTFVNKNNIDVSFDVNMSIGKRDGSRYYGNLQIENNKELGVYKVGKIVLTSSIDKTYEYSTSKGNLTSVGTLILKGDDRIVAEEIGAKPQSTTVNVTNGVAKAEVAVKDTDSASYVDVGKLDEAAKSCADENYTFDVESAAIPANTTIEIGKVLTGNIYEDVKEVIQDVVEDVKKDIRVFEINLLDKHNDKIQPINGGNVSITTDVPTGFNPSNIVVYRLDGANKVKVDSTVQNDKITFTTNHFSTYIIAQTAGQGQIVVPTPDPDDILDTEDEEDPVIIASEERPTGSATTIKDKSPVTSDSAHVVVLLLVFVSAVALFGMCVSKKIIK